MWFLRLFVVLSLLLCYIYVCFFHILIKRTCWLHLDYIETTSHVYLNVMYWLWIELMNVVCLMNKSFLYALKLYQEREISVQSNTHTRQAYVTPNQCSELHLIAPEHLPSVSALLSSATPWGQAKVNGQREVCVPAWSYTVGLFCSAFW